MKLQRIDLYKHFHLEKKAEYKGILYLYISDKSYIENPTPLLYPAMFIIPGGGYSMVSNREAEAVALSFLSRGFISAYLDYSVNVPYPVSLMEAMLAMKYLRIHSRSLNIRKDRIAAVGFSAGGHLLGLLSTTTLKEKEMVKGNNLRPDASIYSYSVITTDKRYENTWSIDAIFNGSALLNRDDLSIEKRVDKKTPIAFIWHCEGDTVVDKHNSLLLKEALDKYKIDNELFITKGEVHGYSTCTMLINMPKYMNEDIKEASIWVDKSVDFLLAHDFKTILKDN